LSELCRVRLASYKVPRIWWFVAISADRIQQDSEARSSRTLPRRDGA
jgi:hypothetical protein